MTKYADQELNSKNLYVCMYVCMHVCMCMYVYVCMYAYMYVRERVYVCMCVYMYIYVCVYSTRSLLPLTQKCVPCGGFKYYCVKGRPWRFLQDITPEVCDRL